MNTTKLKNVCVVVSGSTPKSTDKRYWNGTHVWITPAELSEDSFIVTDSERHITDEAIKATGLKSFPKGTVLLSSRAPIGKVAIAGCEMYCNQGFKNLICSESIYNLYLYYFLKSKTAYLNSLGRGATFKEISKGIVEDISIPFPVYSAQIRIAKQLQKISELISLKKGQYRYFDDIIRSRFLEMFGNKEYSICQLSDQCEIITKGTTPTTIGYNFTTDGVRFIKIENITEEGKFDTAKMMHISDECNMIMKRSQLKSGDLLFSIAGAIGRCAVVTNDILPANINQALAIIRLRKDAQLSRNFLFAVLKSSYVEKQYKGLRRGGAQLNLSLKDIGNFKILLPPESEQENFIDLYKQVDKSKYREAIFLYLLEDIRICCNI